MQDGYKLNRPAGAKISRKNVHLQTNIRSYDQSIKNGWEIYGADGTHFLAA